LGATLHVGGCRCEALRGSSERGTTASRCFPSVTSERIVTSSAWLGDLTAVVELAALHGGEGGVAEDDRPQLHVLGAQRPATRPR
jgi:hypothetical protein